MSAGTLNVTKRENFGKNANHRLRASGNIPAIIYSHGTSNAVSVNSKEFSLLFKGAISESKLLVLKYDSGEEVQVFVKDYQRHPVSDIVRHLDFYKITAGEKIHTTISLEFVGNAIGVKKGGVFESIERVIEVEVLPADLVEKLTVDISNVDINEAIHVRDLKGPASMTFMADADHVLGHVVHIRDNVVEPEEKEGGDTAAVATTPSV